MSTPPPVETIGGVPAYVQRGPFDWNPAFFHSAFLAIRFASIGVDSLRSPLSAKVTLTIRASTFAAQAGTVIQYVSSFVGNDSSFRKRSRPKTTARPVKALRSAYAPYMPPTVSLGTDHTAQGMNFTPCAFPVVTEATELYCFSTPARLNQCPFNVA
jgi:hypothetical protein